LLACAQGTSFKGDIMESFSMKQLEDGILELFGKIIIANGQTIKDHQDNAKKIDGYIINGTTK